MAVVMGSTLMVEPSLASAAAVPEMDGTFTNTQRLIQFHDKAVDPPDDARVAHEALGHELAPRGVSVTLISPGFVASEIRRVDNRGALRDTAPRDPIPAWLVMPAERAARQIVRAVARRRREVVLTPTGKLAVFLQRHAPWLVAWGMRRFGVRSRGEPGAGG